ncbi:unnamed protein product [Symbiodinium sp. KB8]|nr:unnamed protein product [Symbiodinium sp. KB8]
MGMALGAIGAASLMAPAVQAFVAPSAAPAAPQLRGATEVAEKTSARSQAVAATAVASAALALASSGRRAGRGAATARRAEATGATTEKPFAGGLIGGESAFAGQDFNFDPLGLSVKCEKPRAQTGFASFLFSAGKHGRIAMLAFVGLVVPEVVRIPGPRRGSLGFRVLSPKFKFFHLHWFLAWTRVEPPMLACCRCSSCHCCYCCVAACYMSRVV